MSAKSRGSVERGASPSFVDALQHTFDAEEFAKKKGLLQRLDPRIKIFAIFPAHPSRGTGKAAACHRHTVRFRYRNRFVIAGATRHAGTKSLARGACLYRIYCHACAFLDAWPDDLHPTSLRLEHNRARAARRSFFAHACGDRGDVVRVADSLHSMG